MIEAKLMDMIKLKLGKMNVGELGSELFNYLIGRFEKICHDSLRLTCSKP